jgi:hypothetical protein
LIKIESRLGRFVACVVSIGAVLAVFVALGVAALTGNANENTVPPCEVMTADGVTLRLTLDEARAAQPVNANGVPINPEPSSNPSNSPNCAS